MKRHLQLLIGRRVRDVDGNIAGRIFEVIAKIQGDECLIVEFHLGPAALRERLGISAGRLLGLGQSEPLRVPWDQLDVSNADDLRLRCRVEELRESSGRRGR